MAPVVSAPRAVVRPWLPAVALVVAVVLAYANSLRAPFLFDDAGAVLGNATIRDLGSLAIFHPPTDGSTTTGRPVVNVSFALNYALGGENVVGYHAVNLAIHALAALTLFGLLRRTPRFGSGDRAQSSLLAWFAALLWALHPLQTESVTCVAQRTESLCGLFYLLTLYGFVRAEGLPASGQPASAPPRRRWLGVSLLACLLGMATKEVMVSAPLVVLLYDRTFVAGSFAAAWRRRRAYYVLLGATWLLLLWLVTRAEGARGASAGFGLGVSWWTYFLKQAEALVLYLRLSLWPYPLVLDYGTAVTRSAAEVAGQGSIVLALLAATGWSLWRRPVLGFAGAWFFLILAPSSSVVPLVTQTVAEHRMYLPLAALVGLFVVLVQRRLAAHSAWLLAACALACGAATVLRNHDYRDAVSIWADTAARCPTNPRAHNNLALTLIEAGRPAEAHDHYARAVALDPGYVSARYNWGVTLLASGRLPEAATQLEAAVRLAPLHGDAALNLGSAFVRLGRPAEAVPLFERALARRPAADAHYNLAVALAQTGRAADAAAHLHAALRLDARLPDAHYQLGRLAEQAGRPDEAERAYGQALQLDPAHLDAHRRLGLLCARAERLTPAAEHFRAVIRLAPADAAAHANLGNVLLLAGQPREAIAHYEAALRLRPDDTGVRENLRVARDALR